MPETVTNPERAPYRSGTGPAEGPNPQQQPSFPPLHKIILFVIFILIAFIAGAGYYIWKEGSLADLQKITRRVVPTSSPAPSLPPVSSTLSFTGCEIEKQGNPLVEDVRVLDIEGENVVVGTMRGNINQISFGEDQKSAKIELISPKAEQTYTFTAEEETGLVYDGIELKDLNLLDLKQGMTVVASFNCFSEQDNKFLITRITVTGK